MNIIFIMSKNYTGLRFNNLEEVKQHAQTEDSVLVVYKDYVLDVTSFAKHHPGGAVLLRNNNGKNIQEEMKFHQPLTLTMANTMAIGSFKQQISRLIQLDQPLMSQIWNLNHQDYLKVVNSPHWLFVQSPRFFQTDFMQSQSHNKWYHVPFVPFALIAYLFYSVPSWTNFNLLSFILTAIAGIIFFSLVEYTMHRFLFHSENYLPDSRVIRYLHYVLHGVHHMLPNDPDRLVLPPSLVIVILTIGYYTLLKVFVIQNWIIYSTFWSFFLLGYVIYDITHYALHHVDTAKHKGSWFHQLQRYHNKHHFSGQDAGYGVSSPLWDIILRTGYKYSKGE